MNKLLLAILMLWALPGTAQIRDTSFALLANERWWGGAVVFGTDMPFGRTDFAFDLNDHTGNQNAPLLISDKGRWVHSETPFAFAFKNDSLHLSRFHELQTGRSGNSLASAYEFCSQNFFPPSGLWVDSLLITAPQYNLWIELMYEPGQEDVLRYSESVLKTGFPPGVLMIDDNWSRYYGEFDFDRMKFPDPAAMMQSLHQNGFKVMVWVCPFVSPDSKEFRELAKKRYLLLDRGSNDTATWSNPELEPLIIQWWNGYSACLDLTNPEAVRWLKEKLNYLQKEYGIDGFKFDAGDATYYRNERLVSYKTVSHKEHCRLWAEVGLAYPLNEYRAMWKMAGKPLVQRLNDKSHTWWALQSLIPNTIAQQLLGYTFTCPDMIGGGQFTSFLPGSKIDQNLIVRSAQCHALMPMMQFSVAPWRILDSTHLAAVKKAVQLRGQKMDYIMDVTRRAVRTGAPVLRSLAYNFPKGDFAGITDQFMIGDSLMVAPMVAEGVTRQVILPEGKWRYLGKTISGGRSISIQVPLDELPFFEYLGGVRK